MSLGYQDQITACRQKKKKKKKKKKKERDKETHRKEMKKNRRSLISVFPTPSFFFFFFYKIMHIHYKFNEYSFLMSYCNLKCTLKDNFETNLEYLKSIHVYGFTG